MSIAASATTTSRATVDVKRYVLPRFKVALTLDQPYYQPGQVIKGRVQADYVFGKPVTDGVVNVAIEATDVARSLSRSSISGPMPGVRRRSKSHCPRRSSAGSRMAVTRVAITATVRDPAGQTQGRTESRVVAAQIDPDRGDPRSRRTGQGSAQHDPPPDHHARRPACLDSIDRLRPRS